MSIISAKGCAMIEKGFDGVITDIENTARFCCRYVEGIAWIVSG